MLMMNMWNLGSKESLDKKKKKKKESLGVKFNDGICPELCLKL